VFWAPRIEINRTASIPSAFEQCELTGRVALVERAAAVLRGESNVDKRPPGYPFDESDLYKVIEGASYSLSVSPDPKLDAYVDGLIAKIAAARSRTVPLHHPHDRPGEPAPLGRQRALAAREGGQPRALQPRPSLRGRGRPLPGHRQALAAGDRDEERRPAGAHVRAGQGHHLAGTPGHRDRLVRLYL
jgi:hypothetical protein